MTRKSRTAPGTLEPGAFRAIAEFTYDWESWVDTKGRVLWVNAAVQRMTGYAPEACLSMEDYPLPLIHPDDRPRLKDICAAAAAGGSANHIEFRTQHKDGSSRWAAISYQPMFDPDGSRTGYRSSVRDIEERKQMEARLERALEAAEEANRAKTRFLASVSHELRTPLQSILGHAELLKRAHLDAPLQRYAEAMTSEGEHLARLVGDLLDFSALEAGGLTIISRPFNPATEFSPRIESLARAAARKGLELKVDLGDPNVSIESDPDRCLQILTNLATNAIQYTSHGHVEVIVRAGTSLSIEVNDTGPGLPTGVDLFRPFRRGDHAEQTSGFGLGLAITQRLCARMGGSLTGGANPRPPGGTRMKALIPVGLRAHAHVSKREDPKERAIVLIVDDTASSRAALSNVAEALGHQARQAASLAEALAIPEQDRPDLILLDLNMPGPEDVTTRARLLRERFGDRPRLFLMSAGGIWTDPSELKASGVDSFVQKPIALENLRRIIERQTPWPAAEEPGHAGIAGLSSTRLTELRGFIDPGGRCLGQRIALRLQKDAEEILEHARAAAQRDSAAAWCRALHQVSGLAALLGATDVQTLAQELEEGARENKLPDLRQVERLTARMVSDFLELFPPDHSTVT